MASFLYYWKKYASDVEAGPIFKLNQNSPIMQDVAIGDDVFAIGRLAQGLYGLLARFTVLEVGENDPRSEDAIQYGRFFFKSSRQLSNYFDGIDDVEGLVRSLSIMCNGSVLGQCFQGGAAVRLLTSEDRTRILDHIARH